MSPLPLPAWARDLARVEGALPFLSPTLAAMLAARSLRRLWAHHVEAFPFDNNGLEHNPGLDAACLARSWHSAERRDVCAWVAHRGPPLVAAAAHQLLAAKAANDRVSTGCAAAEIALARLDAVLPTADPLAALERWIRQLREGEVPFLEGETETHLVLDRARARPAPRGAAWAASLAVAMRPQLFGLGAAPLALAGLAPRRLFAAAPEAPLARQIAQALDHAAAAAHADLTLCHRVERLGQERLATRNRSSHTHALWPLLFGLGPLTRAEAARALAVTKATAAQAAQGLVEAGLISLRADGALVPVRPF